MYLICYTKLSHAWELRNAFLSVYEKLMSSSGSSRQKRSATSPVGVTPILSDIDSQDHGRQSDKPVKKVRRQLLLGETCDQQSKHLDASGDHNEIVSDHTYTSVQPIASKHVSPLTQNSSALVKSSDQTRLQYEIVINIIVGDFQTAGHLISEHRELFFHIKSGILDTIDQQCQSLCCRSVPFSSVLWRYHTLDQLMECKDLISLLYKELKQRVPLLLDVLSAVAVSQHTQLKDEHLAPLVSAYSILMKRRHPTLSAWHKMTTCITLDGNIDDSDIPALNWMKDFIPQHMRHGTYGDASRKSLVFQLPIQFKNEAKHEDCLDIMDEYEKQLQDLFIAAHGDISALDKFKVCVGGDQLTRVRLKEAKELRGLAPTPTGRLEHLDSIVIEWWHTKQNVLEKAFKALYKPQSGRQEGTLYNLKMRLQLTNINDKVKQNFQVHHEFFIMLTNLLIIEQALEYFGMESTTSEIVTHSPGDMAYTTRVKKAENTKSVLCDIINEYGYVSQLKDVNAAEEEDEVYNYFMQVCHWGLQIMKIDDTAKEADGERSILNAKYNIPFLFSHSSHSKYMVENVLYIMQSLCLSPLQRARVLDCAFVNVHGGEGKNVEADLVQEHSVRNQKKLIRQLGANKTEKAITRATAAAHGVVLVSDNIQSVLQIPQKSTRHCKNLSSADAEIIRNTLRKVRPFHFTPGRKCVGFPNCKGAPERKFPKNVLLQRLSVILERLKWGDTVDVQKEPDELTDDQILPEL